MRKGLKFILTRVEKADKDSLYVTDVRGTQLQSKIGPYVDTFLVNLVLAELKGKAGDDEGRLTACLEKTMTKIVKHQTADGGFAGNGGSKALLIFTSLHHLCAVKGIHSCNSLSRARTSSSLE